MAANLARGAVDLRKLAEGLGIDPGSTVDINSHVDSRNPRVVRVRWVGVKDVPIGEFEAALRRAAL